MNQRYNENIKNTKSQDTQLGILKAYSFCRKIQQRALDPGESAGRVLQYPFVFEITPKHLAVEGRTQLKHSSHIIKVGVEATC